MPVQPIDRESLFQVCSYTDGKGASLEVRYPTDSHGDLDENRPIEYLGQYIIGVQTPQGLQTIPHSFSIPADSLAAAFDLWLFYGEKALHDWESEMTRRQFLSGGSSIPKGSLIV